MYAAGLTAGGAGDAVLAGTMAVGALREAAQYVRTAYQSRQNPQRSLEAPVFTDPAAAVSGGTGYAFALPDAPGVSTRGSIGADQYQDYTRAAGSRDPESSAQRAIAQGIRDTEAHGTASLPVRPAALPLTNAPVGQTPGSSSLDPRPPMATEMGQAGAAAAARLAYGPMPTERGCTREQQRAQGMAALQRSREGLDSRNARLLRADGR